VELLRTTFYSNLYRETYLTGHSRKHVDIYHRLKFVTFSFVCHLCIWVIHLSILSSLKHTICHVSSVHSQFISRVLTERKSLGFRVVMAACALARDFLITIELRGASKQYYQDIMNYVLSTSS
jgi:hypothetical protein